MNVKIGVELRRLLTQLSGHSIGDRDYVAYFINEYGEEMVFVREPGKSHAVLLHSDLGWEPMPVKRPPKSGAGDPELSPGARQFLGDVPVLGDVILNPAEAVWLKACLFATERW